VVLELIDELIRFVETKIKQREEITEDDITKKSKEMGYDFKVFNNGYLAAMRLICGMLYILKENPDHLKEVTEKIEAKKLLLIELDDKDSVPVVYHQGEKVNAKVKIQFEWETKTGTSPGKMEFKIQHYEKGDNNIPVLKEISLERGNDNAN